MVSELVDVEILKLLVDKAFRIEWFKLSCFNQDPVFFREHELLCTSSFQCFHQLAMYMVVLRFVLGLFKFCFEHVLVHFGLCYLFNIVMVSLVILRFLYHFPFFELRLKFTTTHQLQLVILKFADFQPFWFIIWMIWILRLFNMNKSTLRSNSCNCS